MVMHGSGGVRIRRRRVMMAIGCCVRWWRRVRMRRWHCMRGSRRLLCRMDDALRLALIVKDCVLLPFFQFNIGQIFELLMDALALFLEQLLLLFEFAFADGAQLLRRRHFLVIRMFRTHEQSCCGIRNQLRRYSRQNGARTPTANAHSVVTQAAIGACVELVVRRPTVHNVRWNGRGRNTAICCGCCSGCRVRIGVGRRRNDRRSCCRLLVLLSIRLRCHGQSFIRPNKVAKQRLEGWWCSA